MKRSVIAIFAAATLSLGACTTADGSRDTLASAGTGAGVGAAAGAGLGAVVGGLSPIEGALIGAAVGGIAGAIWADQDNDGYADGYVQNGVYYPGRPPEGQRYQQPAPAPVASGERG
ncbi:glycine zipper domain-containing protein [Sphingosinicella terrae]|jgi:predicted small secreted protein|uniref:glycine zipper domain-containing protein n=1 Tax=Sphingosinicella terrae TaxID=2172047 RepID=UPI000E0DDFD2|nr:glycine zipper domain-containing protein [Sphingosinicella terrae]